MTTASVQAAGVHFNLHTLGWKGFQDLCLAVVSEVLGQTVQSFLSTDDGGRDGAFAGTWMLPGGEQADGTFVVQCKFTGRPGRPLRLSHLVDEVPKARRLAERGLADHYLLLTNHPLTGVQEEEIRAAFQAVPGIRRCVVLGEEWITRTIQERPRLRMLVPRVYGLGDLGTILDERAYAQAQEILQVMGEDLRRFVRTRAHVQAAHALLEHGFVLLLGEPAAGKSTIAATLSIGAADLWGASAVKVRDADDFVRHSNPHDPRQLFWIDDAFGATQYDRGSVWAWNRVLPHLAAAVRRGARVVMTSRDYVYRAALQDLKTSEFPLLGRSQVVVDVEDLSEAERAQIVYNHMKHGDQPAAFRAGIKPLLPRVAGHPRFKPEIARRLGTRLFTAGLACTPGAVERFVAEPVEWLSEVIRTLDVDSRAALALIFMSGGALASPLAMTAEERHALELLGATPAGVRGALSALQPSLVRLVRDPDGSEWRFRHPSIRDALAAAVGDDPELLVIYLAGAPVHTMLREISCGVARVEGVRVVVPRTRYAALAARLRGLRGDRRLYEFLETRGDAEFDALRLAGNTGLADALLAPRTWGVAPELRLAAWLHERALLPERVRAGLVEQLGRDAVERQDAEWVTHPGIRKLFTDAEFEAFLERVRADLLPWLEDEVYNWKSLRGTHEDPDLYFQPLAHSILALQTVLEDEDSRSWMEDALRTLDSVLADIADEEEEGREDDDEGWTEMPDDVFAEASFRSIFDDVDE